MNARVLPIVRSAVSPLILLVAIATGGLGDARAQLPLATPAPQNVDMANWMRDLDATIGNRPLKLIVIPGTHDAAMHKGMKDGDLAKNQDLDLVGQLEHGVRYIELRLGYFLQRSSCPPGSSFDFDPIDAVLKGDLTDALGCWSCPPNYGRNPLVPVTAANACMNRPIVGPFTKALRRGTLGWQDQSGNSVLVALGNKPTRDDYYLYGHGGEFTIMVDVKLRDALAGVRAWLDRHPREVVIFNVRMTASDPAQVYGIFRSYFPNLVCGEGDRGIPGLAGLPDRTLNEIRARSQVVLLDDAIDRRGRCRTARDDVGYDNKTSGTQDPRDQTRYLNAELDKVRPITMAPGQMKTLLSLVAPLTLGGKAEWRDWIPYLWCQSNPVTSKLCVKTRVPPIPPVNPYRLAQAWNPNLVQLVEGAWRGRALNIVTFDYAGMALGSGVTVPKVLVQRNLEQR